jgi:hypothetical protein
MKNALIILLAACFTLSSVLVVFAADPVDLRGKRGVVDPKDLKRYDPPERSLHIKEPPSPPIQRREPVEPSHSIHRDSGPEHPKADVRVPGPAFRPQTGVPIPGR